MKISSILITGGTGSFGQAFVAELIRKFPKIQRLVVFSRDELKQFEMAQKFPVKKYPGIRFFLGLYRDWETDRKGTRLNSSHSAKSRMPSSA